MQQQTKSSLIKTTDSFNMAEDKFRVIVKALITYRGEVLIGKKKPDNDHPMDGEWHILNGYLEKGEQVEEAITREIKEKTGLEIEVHQTIDVMSSTWDSSQKDTLQIVFHCEAPSKDAKSNGLEEVKWIKPSEITEYVHSKEAERLEKREEQYNFIEKLDKMPVF